MKSTFGRNPTVYSASLLGAVECALPLVVELPNTPAVNAILHRQMNSIF